MFFNPHVVERRRDAFDRGRSWCLWRNFLVAYKQMREIEAEMNRRRGAEGAGQESK
jgi:hypothetical protein